MKILMLSVGIRNKIVQYFKRALSKGDEVIATDMSELAPAVYEADKFYKVPPVLAEGYIDAIYDICLKEKIDGIVSLMDDDLSMLAKECDRFKAIGTTFVGSSYELCERSMNKWEMYNWLVGNGYKTAKSYIDLEEFFKALSGGEVDFPVFVKPICGGGSNLIAKVDSEDKLKHLFKDTEEPLMIQEFLNGKEIGADVYIDMISGETVSIFTKEKLTMRSGETHKSVSFKDEKLFNLLEDFSKKSGYVGQIDVDVFEVDGEYYISEVNPRFGGGYPHAYECGCDHMKMIVNNLSGIANDKRIGCYEEGIYLLKYNEVMVKKF